MAINDLFGLIHYQTFSETIFSGVDIDSFPLTGVKSVYNPQNIEDAKVSNLEANLKTGFNKSFALPENATASVLDRNPKIADTVDAIQRIVQWVSQTYNVNMKFEISGTAPSGFSLLVENTDLIEAREDDIEVAKIAEQKIYRIIQRQTEVFDVRDSFGNKFKLPKLTKDNKLSIDFQEGINFPIDRKEEDERWEWKFKWNIATPIDRIQSENPDLDEEAAYEKWQKNKKLNRNLTTAQESLINIANQEGIEVEPETNTGEQA